MKSQTASGPFPLRTWRIPIIGAVAAVAFTMAMAVLSTPQSARAATTAVCYVVADNGAGADTFMTVDGILDGTATSTIVGGTAGQLESTGTRAIAVRSFDSADLSLSVVYAWDDTLGLFTIDPATGKKKDSLPFTIPGDNVKVEGMTVAMDDDGDAANDQMWFSYSADNTAGFATAVAGFNMATGDLVEGPYTILDLNIGAGLVFDTVTDIAWDGSSKLYASVASSTDASGATELVTIDPATGDFTVVGRTPADVQGLAWIPTQGLFATTGPLGGNSLVALDPATGDAIGDPLVDFATANGVTDPAAIDCASQTVETTTTSTTTTSSSSSTTSSSSSSSSSSSTSSSSTTTTSPTSTSSSTSSSTTSTAIATSPSSSDTSLAGEPQANTPIDFNGGELPVTGAESAIPLGFVGSLLFLVGGIMVALGSRRLASRH